MKKSESDSMVERYRPLVDRVARSVSPNCAEDDDALQSGLIGLWEAAQRWDGNRPFEPLANTCIRHNIIDYLRRQPKPQEELKEDYAEAEAEEADSKEDLEKRIRSAFARRSREYIVLHSLLRGKTKEQIADKLGVSKRTIDRIAKKAWAELQKEKEGD